MTLLLLLLFATTASAQGLPTNFNNFLFFPTNGCGPHTPITAPLSPGAICSDIPTGAQYNWNGSKFVLAGSELFSVNAGAGQVTATTAYFSPQGGVTNATTETSAMKDPLWLPTFVHNLSCYTSVAPGGATSDAFTLRSFTTFASSATVTPLTCTISGSNTICSDTTHMVTLPAGAFIDYQDVTTGTPAARTIACSAEIDQY